MKTGAVPSFSLVSFLLFALLLIPCKLSGQAGSKDENVNAIPDKLNAVFRNSCMPCHWKGGKFKSTFHLNFSKWDNYSSEKQAEKAKKICTVLLDEDMPPAFVREAKPDIVPTKEQVDAVCKWSATIQPGPQK